MPAVVEFGDGDHQQTMLFAGVALNHRRTVISACLIGPERFLHQGLLQIDHEVFIKF